MSNLKIILKKVTVQLLEALRQYRRAGLNLPYDEVLLKAELLLKKQIYGGEVPMSQGRLAVF